MLYQSEDITFLVEKSNFVLLQFYFVCKQTHNHIAEQTEKRISAFLAYFIHLQEKEAEMGNLNLRIYGGVMKSEDPLNLHAHDIWVDHEMGSSGFIMDSICDYPEA